MLGEMWRRVAAYCRRKTWGDDLNEEMRWHLHLRARELRERGLSPERADRLARLQFGNPVALREISSEQWRWLRLDSFLQDLRFAVRRIGRDRSTSAAIVLTLGLGVGANTAMFTVLDQVLMRPAPAADPERLAWLLASRQRTGQSRGLSFPELLDIRRAEAFSGVAAFSAVPLSLGGTTPARIRGSLVSGNYFDVLGIHARAGRTLRPDDDAAPGANPVAVLSHALWTSHFGAEPGLVGQPIVLNGRAFEVIGVAPAGFHGLEMEPVALWLPLSMAAEATGSRALLTDRTANWLSVFGRLNADVSFSQATAALAVVAADLDRRSVSADDEVRLEALPIAGTLDPSNRREALPVFGLLSAVPALVLVVACANAANLLLAAGFARGREFSLRRSLGATRPRLMRQLLTESGLLAIVGALVGVAVSLGLIALVVRVAGVPPDLVSQLRPSGRVLVASGLLAGIASVLIGLAPALMTTRTALLPELKDAGPASGPGPSRHWLRDSFVISQIAVSFVLISIAGLFLKSVSRTLEVDPGFDMRQVVVLSFDPDLQGYSRESRARFTAELLRTVRTIPGVDSAALSSAVPLAGRLFGAVVEPDDHATGTTGAPTSGFFTSISPGYFRTLRIGLVQGRDFTESDDETAPAVAIVSETFASRLWPRASPIGARFRMAGSGEPWREVIGVVRDTKYDDYTESPKAFFYLPDRQQALGRLTLVVRGTPNAPALIAGATQVARTLDPDLPLFEVGTLESAAHNAIDRQQAISSVIGVLGCLAMALATLGVYAVTSRGVTRREREIAIRMALGAPPSSAVMLFVRESSRLSGIGLSLGIGVSLAISNALEAYLFGVDAADIQTYAIAAVMFGSVALIATVIPARRAAAVEPLAGLRHE